MARGQGSTVGIIIALLVVAVVGLNYMQHLNSPTDQEIQQQQDAAAAAKAKTSPPPIMKRPTGPPKMPTGKMPVPPVEGPDSVAPGDFVAGNPNAATVVALGYTMDAETAEDPSHLDQIANNFRNWSKNHPNDLVKIICLDLPQDQLSNPADDNIPLGLSINGKTVGGCDTNPGEGLFTVSLGSTVLGAVN